MRHIKTNVLTSVTVDSADANYPIANTQDTHPSKPWKAASGVNEATISADATTGITDIVVFGTNALSASLTAEDPNEMSWGDDGSGITDLWGDDGSGNTDLWANTGLFAPTITQYQRSISEALWIELDYPIGIPASIYLTLTAESGSTVQAGLVQSAAAETYGGYEPERGIQDHPDDRSIEAKLSNGAMYYKKRDVLRKISFTVLMATEYAHDIIDFYQSFGKKGTAWRVVDSKNKEWIFYGYIEPIINFDYPNYVNVNITLTEVL